MATESGKKNRVGKEKIITVFGSSRPQEGDADYAEARELGMRLAGQGFAVCSGGYGGVMEAVSRGAKEAGGKTYGVTTEFFSRNANQWIDVEVRKKTWEERLFALIELGDAFVACKGGTGTLAELAVVWEMLNKSVITARPFAVLGEFWAPILQRMKEVEKDGRTSSEGGTLGEAKGEMVKTARTAGEVVKYIAAHLST